MTGKDFQPSGETSRTRMVASLRLFSPVMNGTLLIAFALAIERIRTGYSEFLMHRGCCFVISFA
jgi:hypothetical protein